jgi:hypothetical protein
MAEELLVLWWLLAPTWPYAGDEQLIMVTCPPATAAFSDETMGSIQRCYGLVGDMTMIKSSVCVSALKCSQPLSMQQSWLR